MFLFFLNLFSIEDNYKTFNVQTDSLYYCYMFSEFVSSTCYKNVGTGAELTPCYISLSIWEVLEVHFFLIFVISVDQQSEVCAFSAS